MNLLAILGLIVVAAGSVVVFIAKEILLAIPGFLVVALGSKMLYVASRRDSQKDSARAERLLDEKIDAVRNEISVLASQPSGREKEAALDSIDAEFGAWAEDFLRNRGARVLKLSKWRLRR